jgi:putative SOS response-associated peptidase YedK
MNGIIARDADQTVATIHDRMPPVLPAAVFEDWLHGAVDACDRAC